MKPLSTGALLLAFTLASAGWAVRALAEPPPVSYFTRDDLTGTLKISPDGRHYGVIIGRLDASALAVVDVASGNVIGGIRARSDRLFIDFDWVSNERLLYQVAERAQGQAFAGATGELYATDIDGRNQRLLYGFRAGSQAIGARIRNQRASTATARVISTLPDAPGHVLITEQPWRLEQQRWIEDLDARPRISRLDVLRGRPWTLERAPLAAASVLVDHDHRPRFAVGWDDDGSFKASWKPDPEGDWRQFALDGFIDDTVIPQLMTADDRGVWFTAVREGDAMHALYRLELASGQAELVHRDPEFDVGEVVLDPARREVIGVRYLADRPWIHWLDPANAAVAALHGLERAFPGSTLRITSTTADGRLLVVLVQSDLNPGDYYLLDVETREAQYLQAARSWVNPELSRPRELVRLNARDGLALHGYLTRPDEPGPHALVLLPHGGPHGVRDLWQFDWEAQLLASRGFAVLQVNFRGSAGYGRDFESAGFRQWGATMQDDLTDATLWAIEQGIADADRICIVGSSFGAYAALMGVAREPGLYRCAVGHAGIYDLELMTRSGDVRRWRGGRSYLADVLGDDRDSLRARSPVTLADRVIAPVLLIHGEDDWRADHAHAERMEQALVAAGRSVELITLQDEGHGIFDEDSREAIYTRILAFLNAHLQPDEAPFTDALSTAGGGATDR